MRRYRINVATHAQNNSSFCCLPTQLPQRLQPLRQGMRSSKLINVGTHAHKQLFCRNSIPYFQSQIHILQKLQRNSKRIYFTQPVDVHCRTRRKNQADLRAGKYSGEISVPAQIPLPLLQLRMSCVAHDLCTPKPGEISAPSRIRISLLDIPARRDLGTLADPNSLLGHTSQPRSRHPRGSDSPCC